MDYRVIKAAEFGFAQVLLTSHNSNSEAASRRTDPEMYFIYSPPILRCSKIQRTARAGETKYSANGPQHHMCAWLKRSITGKSALISVPTTFISATGTSSLDGSCG